MTKAEAIAMLKRIQEPEAWEPQINQAAFEALDMAIEAISKTLEKEPRKGHWILTDIEGYRVWHCNCSECGKETKHRKLECEDSVPWRIFETVVTAGWGLLLDRDYKCECTKCGEINTITK